MIRPDTATQWERFGREDPYYAVYAVDEFRGRALDEDARRRFFASGEAHVEALLDDLGRLAGSDLHPRTVLDYGCGVGRLVVPFARRAERTVGLDVSPSMLEEARRNCEAMGVDGVELQTADALDRLRPEFDLVHCVLVLQHVPVRQGEHIIERLVELVRPGGVGAIQVTTGAELRHRMINVAMKLPGAPNLVNLARRRPWGYPHMQMNVYDLGRVMAILESRGVPSATVKPSAPYGGFRSCLVLFGRPPEGTSPT